MSVLGNMVKKATSFGTKGFIIGALAGAVIGLCALIVVTAAFSGAPIVGTLAAQATEKGVLGMLGSGAALVKEGFSMLEFSHYAIAAAFGAAGGSVLGATAGIATGAVYGAATDTSNPLPNLMEKAAHNITEKTPALANAITSKVLMKETSQTSVAPVAESAPSPVSHAPELASAQTQSPPVSFRDRYNARQAQQEPETAVASR